MFERYTEKARRVIFFARYEASQFGQSYIETEHLLLGLLREDKALTNRFLRSHGSVEAIRKQVEAHTVFHEKTSTSVDLPLSNECKRVLAYAAEEAERLGHKHIGTEHLLLGLMREENCFAANMLAERGVELAKVREELVKAPQESETRSAPESKAPDDFFRDLIQAALDREFEPVVGREKELEGVIEILCSRRTKSVVLIGDHGVGKTAIVESLAQRIADGEVPRFLAEKRILAFDLQPLTGWTKDQPSPISALLAARQKLSGMVKSLADASNTILFIDELKDVLAPRLPNASDSLKPVLAHGEIQCVGTCTPGEYQALVNAAPWIGDCFRAIYVRPLDEGGTLRALKIRKRRYEEFHEVRYSDEALECAVRGSDRYLPKSALPGKALELLDAVGARVKLRQNALPGEIVEVQKRIKFIVHRMDNSIANHEFEKARFYSDEEKKERENLRVLREKYKLDDSSSSTVSGEDVEAAIAQWGEYPFQP
jgi:ATP-dependent Clp protease ATP-binding subunit ClpC